MDSLDYHLKHFTLTYKSKGSQLPEIEIIDLFLISLSLYCITHRGIVKDRKREKDESSLPYTSMSL